MKVLNYIAILAVLSVSGMLGAQTAVTPAQTAPASATSEANGVRVQTTVNNREINVRVDAQNSSVLASSQDMLNRILAETTKATGTDTLHGKIFNSLISAVKKVAIDEGCRDDISEEIVGRVILKEMKTVKEQIDSCPDSREDLKAE